MIKKDTVGGIISAGSRELIHYRAEIPSCDDEDFPNGFFRRCAENYAKYLESLAEDKLVPAISELVARGARSREIKKELGLPINACMKWSYSEHGKNTTVFLCELRLTQYDGKTDLKQKSFALKKSTMTATKFRKKRIHRLLKSPYDI